MSYRKGLTWLFAVISKGSTGPKAYGGYKQGRIVAKRLGRANIIVDCGVRFGVCEATRRGMEKEEMHKIAEFMERIFTKREKPEDVRSEVGKFMEDLQKN